MIVWKAPRAYVCLALFIVAATVSLASPCAAAPRRTPFAIPSQPAADALVQFGIQSGVSIAFAEGVVSGARTKPVFGAFTADQALAQMLSAGPLGYEFIGPASVRIFVKRAPAPRSRRESDVALYRSAPSATPPPPSRAIAEVIVTAQKRSQNLQNVPVSITALGQRVLEQLGADRFETYLPLSSGVSFAGATGNSTLTIRGISTSLLSSNQQGTVEVLFDDQPSLNRYYARFNSDLRLVDVDRVEVLRGPQGTLFGSGSLGGAIRIISNRPSTSKFEADGQAGASAIEGGGVSHNLKAMLNLPLANDRLALRLVGYSVRDAGFIDNPGRGKANVNALRSTGVRASLAYHPDERLSVTAWAWRQRDRMSGDAVAFLDPRDGEPYQSGSIDPEDAAKGSTSLYNVTSEYDLGRAKLVSVTSYATRRGVLDRDYTSFWQSPAQADYRGDVEDDVLSSTRMFTQEVRAASRDDGRLQWIAGAFYLDQQVNVTFHRTIAGLGAVKNYPSDLLSRVTIDPSTTETALFGEATYTLTDRLTVTAGARWFWNTLRFASERTGYLAGLPTLPRRKTESSATPKFAVTYAVTPSATAYLQAAKGYRTGQNNFTALPDPATGQYPPESYGPDSLWNYEVGLKAMIFDRRLRLNAAAFYIDWSNIQLTRRFTITTFTNNAGNAVSKGVEIELEAAPTDGVSLGASTAYTDARLVSVLPGVPIAPGPLPGAPKWTVNDFIEFRQRHGGGLQTFQRLDHRFVGAKDAGLEAPINPLAARSQAYHTVDLRLGIETPRYAVVGFVRNVLNGAAATGPRELADTPAATTRQVPRTVGLELKALF